MDIHLDLLPSVYCVAQLELSDDIPTDVYESKEFYSFSKSEVETSLLCVQSLLPESVTTDQNWRLFQYKGSMDKNIVGVIARIAQPLADNGIGVIITTTYDSGYFGVKSTDLEDAIRVLRNNSHIINI